MRKTLVYRAVVSRDNSYAYFRSVRKIMSGIKTPARGRDERQSIVGSKAKTRCRFAELPFCGNCPRANYLVKRDERGGETNEYRR